MVDNALLWRIAEYPATLLALALLLEWLLPLPLAMRPSSLVPLLERLCRKVNRRGAAISQQWLAGLLTPLVVLLPALLATWALRNLALYPPAFDLLLLLWLLESRPLKSESLSITQLLRADKLAMARLQLTRWTRRETRTLSAMGTMKATTEMLVLRLLGQWLAVAFWYLLAGIGGALAFRLLQLMSQAFSPKLPANRLFGEPVSRLYGAALLLPGTLFALLLGLFPGGGRALRSLFTQAKRWPCVGSGALLAALAGGLNIQLGGPRLYGEAKVRLPRLGGIHEPDVTSMEQARRRLTRLGWLLLLLALGFELLVLHAHHQL